MARASIHQPAFTGGEFSPLAQGRSDIPQYGVGMALSLNGHAIEEGPWVKRSGTAFVIPTRGRTYGRLLPFDGSSTCAFGNLFTKNNLQFLTATGSLIFDNTIGTITAAVDNGSSCLITIDTPQSGWAGNDQLMLVFPDITSPLYPYPANLEAGLRNRLLTISPLGVVDSTHFYLSNDISQNLALDPSHIPWTAGMLVGAQVMRVKNITTPYTTVQQLMNLRAVQIEYQSVILETGTAPQVVQITTGPIQGPNGADPVFSFGALTMIDGPYFDPSGDTGTLSGGFSGSVTFHPTTTSPFTLVTDVGRQIRLFSQPAQWNGGTYTVGNQVTDASGEWWTCVVGNTGVTPGQPSVINGIQQLAWAPAPFAGSWAWGTITVVTDTSHVTITLDASIPNMALQSANGTLMTSFQLGVYSGTTGNPTCGCYDQGRLILAGAQANRFDTTVSNGVILGEATFSPTDPYGNVVDSNGMSEIFNSRYVNNIQWMSPGPNGIVMGTLNGEFLVTASTANEPLTPTDIQSWMATKYGSAFVEPVLAGMATIYVQKFGQKLIEYLADAFSQKFSGRHFNEWSKHFCSSGIAELAYQEEPFPCVWARMNNGFLAGWTYRRFDRFVSQPPNIAAAHGHIHGRQRGVTSFCIVPGKQGLLERLFCVTNDIGRAIPGQAPVNNYFVEIMQPFFDQNKTALNEWFVDEAPGIGPGADPAFDCGGGQKALFMPTGGMSGFDSTTPNMTGVFPYDTGIPVGNDLSINLVTRAASYLDGQTCLYTLPPFPSRGAQADQTGVSLSVWIGRPDCPLPSGALFSSPALSFNEANSHNTIVSNILGGPIGSANAPGTMLGRTTTGLDAYPGAVAEVGDGNVLQGTGLSQWVNVLISWKTAGDGTCSIIAYANDTQLSIATGVGGLLNNHAGWPFATQPGATKDNGLSVWCIGGNEVAAPIYNLVDVFGTLSSTPNPLVVPSLGQLVQTLFGGGVFGAGRDISSPTALPSLVQYINSLLDRARAQQAPAVVGFTGSGGPPNPPFVDPVGGATGYHGSVAELWIKPGYIDWTVAGNRAKMHVLDNVTGFYKPLSLGSNGGGTTLGSPYVYLSGPPSLFNLNRANGSRLATLGEIIISPLSPPGSI